MKDTKATNPELVQLIRYLKKQSREKQAGIYVHGFRILDFMSNYALLFPVLLLPIFSRLLHQKHQIDELLRLSFLLLVIPSLAVIVPSVLYRTELFTIMYKEHIAVSADVFAILTLSYLGMCVSYTFGALLTANGNLRELNLMALSAVVVSVSLNLILIPAYQVLGAAIANAVTQLLTIVIHIVLSFRIFKLKINSRLIVRLALYLLLLFAAGYLIYRSTIPWLIGFILISVLGLFIGIILNLIPFRGILKLINLREF